MNKQVVDWDLFNRFSCKWRTKAGGCTESSGGTMRCRVENCPDVMAALATRPATPVDILDRIKAECESHWKSKRPYHGGYLCEECPLDGICTVGAPAQMDTAAIRAALTAPADGCEGVDREKELLEILRTFQHESCVRYERKAVAGDMVPLVNNAAARIAALDAPTDRRPTCMRCGGDKVIPSGNDPEEGPQCEPCPDCTPAQPDTEQERKA